jgi:hypothetical protein
LALVNGVKGAGAVIPKAINVRTPGVIGGFLVQGSLDTVSAVPEVVKDKSACFEMLRVHAENKSHEREIICAGRYLDKGPFALEQHAESTFDGRVPEIVDELVVFLLFLSCPFRVKLVAVSYVALQDNGTVFDIRASAAKFRSRACLCLHGVQFRMPSRFFERGARGQEQG